MVAVEVGKLLSLPHRDALAAGVVVGPGHALRAGDVDLHWPQVHGHPATVFSQNALAVAVAHEAGHLASDGVGDDAETVLHVPALGVGDAFRALNLDPRQHVASVATGVVAADDAIGSIGAA